MERPDLEIGVTPMGEICSIVRRNLKAGEIKEHGFLQASFSQVK